MTGCRKSCKKAATSSLPFMEMSVPVVDGIYYKNNDHKENRTPGFPSRSTDVNSDPATAGTAAADPALGRTEPTPGLRKTAHRKAAIQASSFTVVVQQTTQQTGLAGDKDMEERSPDNERADDKDNSNASGKTKDNSACGDRNGPKGAAGCSDQHASKVKVAVSVTADPLGATHTGTQAATTISGTDGIPVVVVPANGNGVHVGRANQGESHQMGVNRQKGAIVDDDTVDDKNILKSAKHAFSCKKKYSDPNSDWWGPFLVLGAVRMPVKVFLERLRSHYNENNSKVKSVNDLANSFILNGKLYSGGTHSTESLKPVTEEGNKFAERFNDLRESDWDSMEFVPGLMKLILELRFLHCMGDKLKDFEAKGFSEKGENYYDCLKKGMGNIGQKWEPDCLDKNNSICSKYQKVGGAKCDEKMTLYNKTKYKIENVISDVLYNTHETEQNNTNVDKDEVDRK